MNYNNGYDFCQGIFQKNEPWAQLFYREAYFILTSCLSYDNLSWTLRIKSQLNILPIGCALCLIEKQVRDLRCPAAVMQSQPQYVTGKPGRRGRRGSRARRTARLERCIVPARDRKARFFLCVLYAFLPESKKAFCLLRQLFFLCNLTDTRS